MTVSRVLVLGPGGCLAVCLVTAALGSRPARGEPLERNFAGSIQLDYMAVPSESVGRQIATLMSGVCNRVKAHIISRHMR